MRTLAVLLLLGSVASAQQTHPAAAAPAPEGLEGLVREVRALRLAVEQNTTLGLRAQVLGQRLAVQDQRLRAASEHARGIEVRLAQISTESANAADAIARLDEQLNEEVNPAKRREVADQQAEMKAHIESQRRVEQELRARGTEAEQHVRAEQAKWEELNGKLDELDRELAAPQPSRIR